MKVEDGVSVGRPDSVRLRNLHCLMTMDWGRIHLLFRCIHRYMHCFRVPFYGIGSYLMHTSLSRTQSPSWSMCFAPASLHQLSHQAMNRLPMHEQSEKNNVLVHLICKLRFLALSWSVITTKTQLIQWWQLFNIYNSWTSSENNTLVNPIC